MRYCLIIVFMASIAAFSQAFKFKEITFSSEYDIRPVNGVFAICNTNPMESTIDSIGCYGCEESICLKEQREVYGFSKNLPDSIPKEELLKSFFSKGKNFAYEKTLRYSGISGNITNLKDDNIFFISYVSYTGDRWKTFIDKKREESASSGYNYVILIWFVAFMLCFVFFGTMDIGKIQTSGRGIKFRLNWNMSNAILVLVLTIATLAMFFFVKDNNFISVLIGTIATLAYIVYCAKQFGSSLYFSLSAIFPTICIWKILDFSQAALFLLICVMLMSIGILINFIIERATAKTDKSTK